MAIPDGTVLVPDEYQYGPAKPDPLSMSTADLSTLDHEQLRAIRREVNKRREESWGEIRRITDKAGDRTLTRNQQAAFDDAESDLDTLTALRDRIDEVLLAGPVPQTAQRAVAPIPSNHSGEPMTSTLPTHSGALLAPEHRMADYLRERGRIRDDEPRLDAGKVLRGIALGRWDNADTERRAMAEGTGSAGGYLVPTALSAEIIDLARNRAQVLRAGARLVPMESEVQNVARQVSDPTVSWRLENSQIATSGPTFDMVAFTARSLAAVTVVSRELLEDSKPDLHGLVVDVLAKAVGLEIDRVALRGSGTAPQPTGLLNASGVTITSLGTNGAAPTWDAISNAVQTVRGNNFEPTAVIDNPRTEGELARQKDSQNRYLLPPVDIADLPRYATNQIPTNLTQGTATTASEVYVGQWDQLWIGVRAELQIQMLVERFADFGQIGFVTWWRGDVQVAHPLAFNVLTGVL